MSLESANTHIVSPPVVSAAPKLHHMPTYLLVDPYFSEPRDLAIDTTYAQTFDELLAMRRQGWQGREIHVATDPNPIIDPRKLPYLIPLQDAQDPLLAQALAMAQQEHSVALETGLGIHRVATLLETELPADQLMQRLQRMWVLWLFGKPRYLRIADPRVMEMLPHLLDLSMLHAWLGPIAYWHHLGRNAQWYCLPGAVAEELNPDELWTVRRAAQLQTLAEQAPRLQFTQQETQKLLSHQTLSAALLQLQRHGQQITPAHYQQGWAYLEQLRIQGVSDHDILCEKTVQHLYPHVALTE